MFQSGLVGNGGLPNPWADRPEPQATGAGSLQKSLGTKPDRAKSPGYYYPDYRPDFPMGDNPYRYYRW
jgi:hypothetical protein